MAAAEPLVNPLPEVPEQPAGDREDRNQKLMERIKMSVHEPELVEELNQLLLAEIEKKPTRMDVPKPKTRWLACVVVGFGAYCLGVWTHLLF